MTKIHILSFIALSFLFGGACKGSVCESEIARKLFALESFSTSIVSPIMAIIARSKYELSDARTAC